VYAAGVSTSYALSHRDDTEYWREIQNREYPEEFFSHNSEGIFRHLYNKFISKNFKYQFDPQDSGWNCMTAGMNWNPIDFPTLKYTGVGGSIENIKVNTEIKTQHIEERKRRWNEQIKNRPSPYQYLKDNIHI
jgi:hypothetical protein